MISGVARISKLGAHRWREGPMRGWGFGGGTAQRASSPSGGLGRAVTTSYHPSQKKSPRICTNPVAMPVHGRGRAPWLRYWQC